MTPSDPLIEALLDPACYEHDVEEIQLTETHISWVLLTGQYAYKIKKPLELPFLDFSTLEQRAHFCNEELRINRRLAPELYLDVVPIGGTREAPRIGATPAIEYAVRMRQFAADARLDRRLASDCVPLEAVTAFAEDLARFHAGLPRETGDADAAARAVAAAALDNFPTLEERLRDTQQRATLARLRRWTQSECGTLADVVRERYAAGFVRECHGDLHLENLVELEGRIVPFDALEFDRSLRTVDVLSEAAFTAMDLMAHRRTDLAHPFQNRYLEVSGDYAGLGVLRYYLVYRALVRAKVRVIKATQDTTLHRAEHGPRPYLRLAAGLIEPPSPLLVITHGLSGSGKTTVTDELIASLGAMRLRSDLERKRLHGLAPDARSGSDVAAGLYDAAASERTYAQLADYARLGLRAGFPMIVDAAFLSADRREQFRELAAQAGASFRILDCRADETELRRRVGARQRRGADASEAGAAVLDHQLATRDPLTAAEAPEVVGVDTMHRVDYLDLTRRLAG